MPPNWLQLELLGNETQAYMVAIATLLIAIVAITLLRLVVLNRLKGWASRTHSDLDDRLLALADRPVTGLLYLGAFYVSIQDIVRSEEFPQVLGDALNIILLVAATVLVVRLLGSLVEYGVRIYWVARHGDALLEQTLRALVPAIKVAVWAVGLVFLLDNLGFDVTAALASLGIGGVAIALASQGVLADLFSYFAILFDRPFEIGDFIITGDVAGTVESVGIKTTRIASIGGEQVVVANTDLTSSRIQNYQRMRRRRIVFQLGVTYDTPPQQLEQLPQLIREAVESCEATCFDRAHFLAYGDFSLNYEVVYFVETNDYAAYMDAQQQINLALKHSFEQAGVEFAYPTQQLYLSRNAG